MSITFSTQPAEDIGCACTLILRKARLVLPAVLFVFMDELEPIRIPVTFSIE